ncbi:MAG TPA: oligopeptide/dipeptide ABC transporter ATP-binding protein [Steroidobacteraceae bacterium]|nr:oligopeptide/dipeptide ABC transporter ATP-binding protein [Steroidobacteraceae bacterium]
MNAAAGDAPLLEARSLRVEYSVARERFAGGRFTALEDVSFALQEGETLGLVGESGSGKSTLARALLRLVPVAGGQVLWRGENLLELGRRALRERRRGLQIVFQNPVASLDPRMTIGEILAEPLRIFERALTRGERRGRIERMLERVGLEARTMQRYPHEFSGGQCQRIAIARAMMCSPRLLICDEPVSSLDVSIQGQIVNLLADLQREAGMAMLFISHNLAVVRQLSHRVLVMFRGRLVEAAPRDALFAAPLHPYTRALLAAVPRPAWTGPPVAPDGAADAPVYVEPPASRDGCVYRMRCPLAQPACGLRPPLLEPVGPARQVACHRRDRLGYSWASSRDEST